MSDVPPLDPKLLERLALAPDAFDAMIDAFIETVPSRPADAAYLETALGYPWGRPDGSYRLADGDVTPASELSSRVRAALRGGASADAPAVPNTTVDADGSDVPGGRAQPSRLPLLAIGANGAPSALTRKLAHLPRGERELLVETGWVDHLDIGAVASPTVYGSFPATPIESHGTRVRAAVQWVSAAQLEALAWSELSYWVGWLDGHPFTPDDGTPRVDRYLVFVARWGSLRLGGDRLALAAIAAERRTARAVTQQVLLDETAQLWLGGNARGRDLLERLATDHAATRRSLAPLLRPLAERFEPPGWRPLHHGPQAARHVGERADDRTSTTRDVRPHWTLPLDR